jgi:hypothetical protein
MSRCVARVNLLFPDVWRAVSYVAGYFLVIPAILLIILVTNEYGFRTHRQNVIDGWSRNQFITAKLLIVLLLAILATVLTIVTAYFLGYLYTDSPMPLNIYTNFHLTGDFFIQALSYLAIAFIIAVPITVLVMRSWLQGFAYRIDLSWWIFAIAGFTAFFIALITVGFQALKVAVANPIKSLRIE